MAYNMVYVRARDAVYSQRMAHMELLSAIQHGGQAALRDFYVQREVLGE